MPLSSPSTNNSENLIFWANHNTDSVDAEGQYDGSSSSDAFLFAEPGPDGKSRSMYVSLFEEMVNTIVVKEGYLFNEQEKRLLRDLYDNMSYPPRLLFVRLCLRKRDKWHRVDNLKYESALGPRDEIIKIMDSLCCPLIDLTQDDEEEDVKPPLPGQNRHVNAQAGPSTPSVKYDRTPSPDLSFLAQNDTHADIKELLDCLTVAELKLVAKQMKIKAVGNRSNIEEALLCSASTQTTLNFLSRPSSSKHVKREPARGLLKTQTDRLREMVMKILGRCIKINPAALDVFRRINVVYFRSTEHTPNLLIPAILVRSKKRNYAVQDCKRTDAIWASREAVLEYEEALEVQAQIDEFLGGTVSAPARGRSMTTATPGPGRGGPARLPTPASASKSAATRSNSKLRGKSGVPITPAGKGKGKEKENLVDNEQREDDVVHEVQESARVAGARAVKEFLPTILPRWLDLVKVKGEEAGRTGGYERFESGHVLTRVVCKIAYALHILKEYEDELQLLDMLLSQKRWRRGRRGGWYERKALVLMEYYKEDKKIALEAVTQGLKDDDTHTVYRPKLVRRLTKLEKQLNIPPEERHLCEGELKKAPKVTIEGHRIHRRAGSLILDHAGRSVNASAETVAQNTLFDHFPSQANVAGPSTQGKVRIEPIEEKKTGKSIWRGHDDEEVNVEIFALQHYERDGYKGFHSEGRIVATLFGMLFFDIIFAPVPGAFETPYQSAPLDIAEDTFFYTRQHLIEGRLRELEAGHAREILAKVDAEHREKGTWCVGVSWDLFERDDLLDIVDCIGGIGLALICRLFCEDYGGRAGGVPDLFIWKAEEKECKFVEVKGPGDTLQENQKVWCDVLVRGGVPVEVCHVVELGRAKEPKSKSSAKGKGKDKTTAKAKAAAAVDSDSDAFKAESEDEDVDQLAAESDGEPPVTHAGGLKRTLADAREEGGVPTTPTRRQRMKVEVVIPPSPLHRRPGRAAP